LNSWIAQKEDVQKILYNRGTLQGLNVVNQECWSQRSV